MTKIQKTDVRIIAATNRDLTQEVKKNNFRQDLYFRLKTINIHAAPLREHLTDLPQYIERFGLEFTVKNDIAFKGFSSEALTVLKYYNWPGNVRELKNSVESLIVMNKGERITETMVKKHLKLDEYQANSNLPVFVDADSDKIERELLSKDWSSKDRARHIRRGNLLVNERITADRQSMRPDETIIDTIGIIPQ